MVAAIVIAKEHRHRCPRCNGRGEVRIPIPSVHARCPLCAGIGDVWMSRAEYRAALAAETARARKEVWG